MFADVTLLRLVSLIILTFGILHCFPDNPNVQHYSVYRNETTKILGD